MKKLNAHVYESTQQQSPEVEHPYDHVQQRAQNEDDYEIAAPFTASKEDAYVDVGQGEPVQPEAGRGEGGPGHQVYDRPQPYEPQEPHSYDVLRPKTLD